MEMYILPGLAVILCTLYISSGFAINEVRYTPVSRFGAGICNRPFKSMIMVLYALVCAANVWRLRGCMPATGITACTVVIAILFNLAVSDFLYRKLPNDQLLLFGVAGLIYIAQAGNADHVVMNLLLAALLAFFLMLSAWLLNLFMKWKLKVQEFSCAGEGDIKMLFLLGLVFGWAVIDIILISCGIALAVMLGKIILDYKKMRIWKLAGVTIAFGWVMSLGALICLVL